MVKVRSLDELKVFADACVSCHSRYDVHPLKDLYIGFDGLVKRLEHIRGSLDVYVKLDDFLVELRRYRK